MKNIVSPLFEIFECLNDKKIVVIKSIDNIFILL